MGEQLILSYRSRSSYHKPTQSQKALICNEPHKRTLGAAALGHVGFLRLHDQQRPTTNSDPPARPTNAPSSITTTTMSAATKQVTFGSGTREIALNKASKWYPAEDDALPKKVGFPAPWAMRSRLEVGMHEFLLRQEKGEAKRAQFRNGWDWSFAFGRGGGCCYASVHYRLCCGHELVLMPATGPQDAEAGCASPVAEARHRPDHPRRAIPGQTCRLPQAPRERCPSRYGPLQDQRRAPPPRQLPLRHCHLHLGRPGGRRCGQVRRQVLCSREGGQEDKGAEALQGR